MNIAMILTNGFNPDPRVFKEAKSLVENGHSVEILSWDRENRYIDRETEIIDGIKIKRFFIDSKYGSGTKQISAYISFCRQLRKYVAKREYACFHAHDIDGMLAAVIVDRKKKIIWDMHEFFDGFNYGVLRKSIYHIISLICFRYADAIIYVIESQKKRYSKKAKKGTLQEIVMNCADQNVFDNFQRTESDKLRVSFIGTVREFDTIKLMMDTAEKFSDVNFYIHGSGVSYCDIKNISNGYRNTFLKGHFEFKYVKTLYENTDIIYSVYDSNMLNIKEAFPAKGFEAIITETPIITNKNTFFGDLVSKFDIGFVIDEKKKGDLEELFKVITQNKKILTEKSCNISKIKQDFLWEKQSQKLIEIYRLMFN